MNDPKRSKPKCLTGSVFSGGACGLIGCKPTNLTITCLSLWLSWCMAAFSPWRFAEDGIHQPPSWMSESKSACPFKSAAHALLLLVCACGIGAWNSRAFNLESLVHLASEPTKCSSQMCTHRPSRCASKTLSEVVTRYADWKVRMDTDHSF